MSATFKIVLSALLVTGSAFADDLKGKLVDPASLDLDETVVFIDEAPAKPNAKKPKLAISQKGARFTPAFLPLVVGSEVDLTNDDWVDHSVFSTSPTKSFDLGLYGKKEKKVVVFDKPGVVELGCFIHPNMGAIILVLKNAHFTRPKSDGSFVLSAVPPGKYTLKAYTHGKRERSVEVTVPLAKDAALAL